MVYSSIWYKIFQIISYRKKIESSLSKISQRNEKPLQSCSHLPSCFFSRALHVIKYCRGIRVASLCWVLFFQSGGSPSSYSISCPFFLPTRRRFLSEVLRTLLDSIKRILTDVLYIKIFICWVLCCIIQGSVVPVLARR